ncbi:anti-sigma regulatory factor (Ser/Thr protein kinase) [Nocardioides sp. BE266]|uniref:sensor histidine kinase n=1 Tax=Nocardioides sp. BE266 TaxID=2817725 RepID=UPI00286651FC|nr:sensor histidine kinase [Nocardioides sp. BE266]MDR7254694.1 anti-sigma regulatory factor (Ser/Thr protein kinase) [Nocardioides sp. BE266]
MSAPATHAALLYDSPRQYAAETGSFLRAGLAQGHRGLVMAPPDRVEWIRHELGRDADEVTYVDDTVAYTPQWNAYRVLLEFAAEAPDVRSVVVAEQALSTRVPAEVLDYRRQEAAANVVFADRDVDLICPYDAGALPAHLLDIARHTHEHLRVDGAAAPNSAYLDPRAVLTRLTEVVPAPPGATTLDCVSHADVAQARRLVRHRGAAAGLGPDAVADMALAVTEVLTNALQHGAPPAVLHLYPEQETWVCHVHDGGTALVDPLTGILPPDGLSEHGYGLWLARQLCAAVDVGHDLTGTHVRLHARIAD